MQWSVRGGSSATRAMRKAQRDRWSPKPLVKGKPLPPTAPPDDPPQAPPPAP